MQLRFLGTRGYISVRSQRHNFHSSLLITQGGKKLMIDCGEDWREKVWKIKPDAIIITHGHPDHAWGLSEGSPAPVYASQVTWSLIENYPIDSKVVVVPGKEIEVAGLTIEAFTVEHSIRCPAIGYRITDGSKSIFYISDVVDIVDRHEALSGIDLYIGDGATPTRPMVRRKGDALFGHTTIRAQIGWCAQEQVPQAIFTHCGTQIVGGKEEVIIRELNEIASQKNVKVRIAHDGMRVTI